MDTEITRNSIVLATDLVLSGFSMPQIKGLIPQFQNVDGNSFIKTVINVSSRQLRKDFIERLEGEMPRLLTEDEKVTFVNEVGEPKGKTVFHNMSNILEMLSLDIENPDLIIPQRKIKVGKHVTKDVLEKRLARTKSGLTRNENSLAAQYKKFNAANEVLHVDSENRTAKYTVTVIGNSIKVTELAIEKAKTKIEQLNEQLKSFPASEVVNQENTENQEA